LKERRWKEMMDTLNRLSIAAYVRMSMWKDDIKESLRSLKDDERGLSGIVVAVLLILVAVLAIVMFWGSLKKYLGDMWGKVTQQDGNFTGGTTLPSGG